MITKTYKIVQSINEPDRVGETKDFQFPYVSANHLHKYFCVVADWANGSIIEEVI